MIKILLIIIAAICKAFADTISPRKSQLSKRGDFWNIEKKGKMLPFTKYPVDGWHLFNSGMIISLIFANVISFPYIWYVEVPILGIVFILTFNLFYNKILK